MLNVLLSYFNIDSIRNKFDDLKHVVMEHADICCVSETKLDNTFQAGQFLIQGCKQPFRKDVTDKSGGLIMYVKNDLSAKSSFVLC